MSSSSFYRAYCSLALLLLLLVLVGCSPSQPEKTVTRLEGHIFGTFWQVTLSGNLTDDVQATLRKGILERLQAVDKSMSTYRDDSELIGFNRHPVGEWKPLSPELMQVLVLSQSISEKSQGAFDVTVGNLVNLWSFGPERRPDAIPDPDLLDERLHESGYAWLILNEELGQARRLKNFFVDLSGVAKGYGVDEVGRYLSEMGYEHYLVNIGGDLFAKGARSAEEAWRVGIELPHEGVQQAHHIIEIRDMSVATSGDYRNYFEVDGQRFSHTISPVTGWPVNHSLASVTVLSPDNASADAWATAMMVMGVEAGLAVAERENLKVLMLERSGDTWLTHISSEFKAYVGETAAQALLRK
ncbi:FAD:protein FMN transferase [Nitrincola alkalisediminis]|uniref:FAD:protein FMN transferase n=1 Tax=Nitrincola alkalisediminis TaxID=1366656 RepID=UPI001875170F|nr:FAD:protein FMN transferase [Nitrincola alkalisediminis]